MTYGLAELVLVGRQTGQNWLFRAAAFLAENQKMS